MAKPDTRRRLIKAATEVVAKHGFHAASVDAIAHRAGFSIGALYWHFANKDELFLAVFDEHVAWFEARLREALEDPEPGRGAAAWLQLTAQRPQQFLIFIEFWAYAVRKPKVRRAFAQRMAQMRQTAEAALAARGAQPAPAALLGLALGRGLALEKLADPDAVDDDAVAALLATLLG